MSQTCESHLVLLLVIFLSFRINRTVQFRFINVILSHRQGLIGSTVQPSGHFLFCYVNHRLTNPCKNTKSSSRPGGVLVWVSGASREYNWNMSFKDCVVLLGYCGR